MGEGYFANYNFDIVILKNTARAGGVFWLAFGSTSIDFREREEDEGGTEERELKEKDFYFNFLLV